MDRGNMHTLWGVGGGGGGGVGELIRVSTVVPDWFGLKSEF